MTDIPRFSPALQGWRAGDRSNETAIMVGLGEATDPPTEELNPLCPRPSLLSFPLDLAALFQNLDTVDTRLGMTSYVRSQWPHDAKTCAPCQSVWMRSGSAPRSFAQYGNLESFLSVTRRWAPQPIHPNVSAITSLQSTHRDLSCGMCTVGP